MQDAEKGYDGYPSDTDWMPKDDPEAGAKRRLGWSGRLRFNHSPLARRIVVFNLIGLLILMAGVFYLNPVRASLALQRVAGLQSSWHLVGWSTHRCRTRTPAR